MTSPTAAGPIARRIRSSTPARLFFVSLGVFFLAWLALWLPVLVTGSGVTLFLWPFFALLGTVAWVIAIAALVLGVVRAVQTRDGRYVWLIVGCALLLIVGPCALAFGPASAAIG